MGERADLRAKGDRLLLAVVVYFAVFGATWLLADLPVAVRPTGLLISTLASLLATGGLVFVAGQLPLDPERVPTVALVAGLGLALLFDVVSVRAGLPLLSSLALLMAALLVAALMDRFVFLETEMLLLLCVLYIVVDVYSVYLGPTEAIVAEGGPLLRALTLQFPIVGTGAIRPLTGGTDYAVWTACMLAARRFGFHYDKSFWAIVASLIATSLIGIGLDQVVPALPLAMVAYIAVNRRHFDFHRRDLWLSAALALALVLAAGVGLRWWLTRSP